MKVGVRITFFGLFLFLSLVCLNVQPTSCSEQSKLNQLNVIWSDILKHATTQETKMGLNSRLVDYDMIRKNSKFSSLIAVIKTISPNVLQSKEEKLAFWINIYNIGAVNLIIQYEPKTSIRDLGSFFSPVWKKKAIQVGNKSYSLDEIEHQILRPMGDPRIHFSIVCASLSCPDLMPAAYTAINIEEDLNRQTLLFLKNPTKGLRVDHKTKTVFISKIFTWFRSDFDSSGGVFQFIESHLNRGFNTYQTKFIPYNWQLNRTVSDTSP